MNEQQLKTFFLRLTICLMALAVLAFCVLVQLGSELSPAGPVVMPPPVLLVQ